MTPSELVRYAKAKGLRAIAITDHDTIEGLEEGLSEGMLAVFFMALIFFVGWSMTTFIMKLLMEPAGFGRFLDRDGASLLLLTIAETIFYYFYVKGDSAGTPEENAGIEHSHNAQLPDA